MAPPLSTEPLSTVHVKAGDILTLGRWQQISVNPSVEGGWQFQQFDLVFTTGEVTSNTIDRDGLDAIHETGDWGVFAIKRPQVTPPVLEQPQVPEESAPAEEPPAEEAPTDS